jgi:hypothetical protein
MPVLSGREIRARLLEEQIARRLVVSPLLIPEEQCRDDQASIVPKRLSTEKTHAKLKALRERS